MTEGAKAFRTRIERDRKFYRDYAKRLRASVKARTVEGIPAWKLDVDALVFSDEFVSTADCVLAFLDKETV